MASKIADKEFLSKNLYQVIARGMQYEVLDAKKAGVKSLINKLTNLTQEPSVEEVSKIQKLIPAMLFFTSQ